MDNSTEYYAKIGRKAVRAGLEMANDIIVNVLRELDRDEQPTVIPVKRGRPPKAVTAAAAPSEAAVPAPAKRKSGGGFGSYWGKMTSKQRRAEMQRRMAVRRAKSDEGKRDAYSAKMSKVVKESWKKRKAAAALINGHAEPTVREVRQQA